jgi:hypothetical protein
MSNKTGKQMKNLPSCYIEAMRELQEEDERLTKALRGTQSTTDDFLRYMDEIHHNRDYYSRSKIIEMAKEKYIQIHRALPKWDCDDCKHYPCIHQEIAGRDKKLKYNQCGDHSKRGNF